MSVISRLAFLALCLPALAFGGFDFLLQSNTFNGEKVVLPDLQTLTPEDSDHLAPLIQYLKKRKPSDDLSLGTWFLEVSGLLPSKVPSLVVMDQTGKTHFNDERQEGRLRS